MLSNSAPTLAPAARLARMCPRRHRAFVTLGSFTMLSQRIQAQQQMRGFGFHWWANHIDREHRHEIRERYRAMRHQFSDAMNRKTGWERQHANDAESSQVYHRYAHHYWQPRRCFDFGRHRRYCPNKERASKSWLSKGGDIASTQPGHSIEDVERTAWGHLLFRDGEARQTTWQSSFDDIREYLTKRQKEILDQIPFEIAHSKPGKPDAISKSASYSAVDCTATVPEQVDTEVDYVIDPITNRKVTKSSAKSTPDEADYMTPTYTSPSDQPTAEAEFCVKSVTENDKSLENVPRIASATNSMNDNQLVAEDQKLNYDEPANYKTIEDENFNCKAPETVVEATETTKVNSLDNSSYRKLNTEPTPKDAAPDSWYGRKDPTSNLDGGKHSATSSRSSLETSMDRINAEHDAIDKLASISVKAATSRLRRHVTDAEREQALHDSDCKEPQSFEKLSVEGLGEEGKVRTPAQTHERTQSTTAKAPVSKAAPAVESFVYKILAYDPSTNTMDMAETSSAIPDTESPLSTSEVLLCLSSPAKFFPYFATLRTQGFEIVAGSGDVLIFRKKEESSSSHEKLSQPYCKEAQTRDGSSAAINPIDMTGKKGHLSPSSANFVSPTGYVNLDLPPLHENEPTTRSDLPPPPTAPASSILPSTATSATSSVSATQSSATTATASASPSRFQSGIGVRREEPVYSGARLGATDSPQKPSVVKRMVVGATWMAGISYAVGVVSEYAKNY
ncbi:hypothetical protein SEPCBS119000_000958 [Sporothrix epigloea]|uniref:Serine-threonine rich protein n=1 Tax=Sporothrix epigloea TaxID=1892477 RepID=A0ABP0DAJ3_9PEZI